MRKKWLNRVLQSYGKPPDVTYFSGDMDSVRSYFEYIKDNQEQDEFFIDDATWLDLDMDSIFKRINLGLSNSGEQYLYYLLRRPSASGSEFQHRESTAKLIREHPELRRELLRLFAQLGRRSNVNIYELFRLESTNLKKLLGYLFLVCLLIASIVFAAITHSVGSVMIVLLILCLNAVISSVVSRKTESEEQWKMTTVDYCVCMVHTMQRLFQIKQDALSEYLEPSRPAFQNNRRLLRLGTSSAMKDDAYALLNSALFLELILYELRKNFLFARQNDFLVIHQVIGELDAAISIASFQESLPSYTIPSMDYSERAPYICFDDLIHPLVPDCVPNSLQMEAPILLTGSNASGKTTFMRTVAVNLILAEGICTALAAQFHSSHFRVITSIDILDNIFAGDSYYIAELKSIRRMLCAVAEPDAPVFCCLDEVLRGTNAIERIAASSEILRYLGDRALCMAATHDIELCSMLEKFALYHFEEIIVQDEMSFDYKLKPGYSLTSNAIKLLSVMDFPQSVITQAQNRVDFFRENQSWREEL